MSALLVLLKDPRAVVALVVVAAFGALWLNYELAERRADKAERELERERAEWAVEGERLRAEADSLELVWTDSLRWAYERLQRVGMPRTDRHGQAERKVNFTFDPEADSARGTARPEGERVWSVDLSLRHTHVRGGFRLIGTRLDYELAVDPVAFPIEVAYYRLAGLPGTRIVVEAPGPITGLDGLGPPTTPLAVPKRATFSPMAAAVFSGTTPGFAVGASYGVGRWSGFVLGGLTVGPDPKTLVLIGVRYQ